MAKFINEIGLVLGANNSVTLGQAEKERVGQETRT
jgi:hypothetical protein